MKRLYILLLCLLSVGFLAANGRTLAKPMRKVNRPASIGMQNPAKADSATGFDVQKYTIDISISQDPGFISGNVTADVLAEEALTEINYDLIGLTVSSVLVDGQPVTFTQTADQVQIPLSVSAGESFQTQVFYSGSPQLSGDFYNVGMYIRSGVIFTISDPDAGRYWWPCYDHPWDKAIVDIIVSMRSDWKVAANGLRESIIDNGDGTSTTTWRGYHPMTTYLACITASNYVEIPQTAMLGTLPILNFVTPSQYQNAQSDLASLPDMIDYFSEIFGDYPFEKYGNATVAMSTFGAMEHQTMTTLGNYIIDGNGTHELTIAHELAHQWYGNAVSFLTFADVWLSEGFATYSEHLWTDKTLGWDAAVDYVRSSYHQYYLNWENVNDPPCIYDPDFNHYFYPQSYEKAASVLHMLRLKLGDEDFFGLLQEWFETYKHGNAVTSEFQAMAEDISGLDLEQFFQQWIFGTGIPSVDYSIWYSPAIEELKVIATSSSPTSTEFDLDLPFRLEHSAGSDSLLIRATPEGYANFFVYSPEPEDHSANHNHWTILRGLREHKPVLEACLPSSSSVVLSWADYPAATGFLVERRSENSETWETISPQPIVGTRFIDTTAENGLSHEYRIRALDADGYQSMPSEPKTALPVEFSFESFLLVIDETRDGNGANISPDDEMVDGFYAAALEGLDYAEWDLASQGLPDLAVLGEYKVILWHDDDFAANDIHLAEDLLSGYMLGGGQLLISGWKTVSALSDVFWDLHCPGLQLYYDNAPVLNGAESDEYANLSVDSEKLVSPWNGMLPFISSFEGDFQSIYTADAADGSQAENRCVGLSSENLVFLGFPLYFMQADGVRDFLQQILPQLGSVSIANEEIPACQLSLKSYPNPFNPSTRIDFTLPKAGEISLKLYNLKGQKLENLALGHFNAGEHSLSFSAETLPSGVYFLVMDAGGARITRKITLLK